MTDNILDSLNEHYNSLTKSGKKLADYIFANAAGTQYMSITALAENCKVSEATITRFCRILGLSGYNDLKLALAKAERNTDLGDPSNAFQSVTSEDDFNIMSHKVHAATVVSLNETLELLDEEAVETAVDYLCQARHVYCFGQGGSMVMAMEAWARFSTTTSSFVHIADSHMQAMAAALCTPEDVILFFSYSGSTKDMVEVLEQAKKNKAKIILITHFRKSRAADFADVVLLCGYNESPLQSGSIAAKVGQMLLIECLFYSFSRRNPEVRSAARTATAQSIANKLL